MLIRARSSLTFHVVRWSVFGFAVLASLALAGAAFAAGSEDPGAVDQYQEQVPTAGGSQGTGGTGGDSNPLSTQVKDDLYQAAGQDAALLEQVATSSSYGAPVKAAESPSPGSTELGKKRIGEDLGTGSAISDTMTAVGDGGGGHLGVLAALLGLIAASSVTAAAYRRKRTGPAV